MRGALVEGRCLPWRGKERRVEGPGVEGGISGDGSGEGRWGRGMSGLQRQEERVPTGAGELESC